MSGTCRMGIERTSIFNLPYGFEVRCHRTTGWVLYDSGARLSPHLPEPEPRILGGEWLILDVDGVEIVTSRDRARDEDDDVDDD